MAQSAAVRDGEGPEKVIVPMAVYSYRAVDTAAATIRGTIAADSPRQAREQLRARGLSIQEMDVHRPGRSAGRRILRRPGRHTAKLTSVVRELSTLLGAGIPLLEALETLSAQHRGSFRTALLLVSDRVAAGSSLAEAMAEQPDVFDTMCVHMVEVGENTGHLDEVLDRLAGFYERFLELRDRVVTSLLYPAVVLVVSVAVTVFLMAVVVPMLLDNLLEAGRQLPWPTRVLKAGSDFLLARGAWLAVAAVLAVVGLAAGLSTARGRRLWHRALLKLPLFGQMALKQSMARIALVIGSLMKTGIVFVKAAEIAGKSARNVVLRDALDQVCTDVGAGKDIGEAMAESGVFPPLVVQIFTVGQQSGKLDEMLERLAYDYDRQVASVSTRLATALEPVLILFLAVVVGFILFATILPILEAGNVL